MGNKITVEEMEGFSKEALKKLEPEGKVKDLKEEVRVIYERRMAEFGLAVGGAAAGDGGAAAGDGGAAAVGDGTEEETKEPASVSTNNPGAEESKEESNTNTYRRPGWAKDHTEAKCLKLVLVGDTAVGKSCLITNYLENSFTDEYEPTVLDVFKGIKEVKKKQINMEIHDTSGDEHLGVNRKIQYKDADCFMICVASNQPTSLESVSRWIAEIKEVEPFVPIALILTKSDILEMADEDDEAYVFMAKITDAKNEKGLQVAA